MTERNGMNRREFLKTTGLAGAAAVVPAGRSGAGLLLSRLIPEDELIPGVSYWPNSTCNECPAGCGTQVRLIDSHATKVEGIAEHPINHGGLCARGQAALQGLYSPNRLRSPLVRKTSGTLEPISWQAALETVKSRRSEGKVVIVGRHVTGAMSAVIEHLKTQAQAPDISYVTYEILEYPFLPAANRACFGIESIPVYKFEDARLIVSFGADFLETWLSPVSYAHGYAATRTLRDHSFGRFIQFESHNSLTGANADERFAIPPGSELVLAGAMAAELIADAGFPKEQEQSWKETLGPFTIERAAEATGIEAEIIRNIIQLLRFQKPSLVIAGGPTSRSQYATELQAILNLINYAAGNYGKTISFERSEHAPTHSYRDTLEIFEAMDNGQIAALIVYDTSLEFAFPDPERLKMALEKVPLKIKLALVKEEKIEGYDIVLPILHWMETWDLVESRSGLKGVRQPIIQPYTDARHAGKILADVVNSLSGKEETSFDYEKFVQNQWEQVRMQAAPDLSFEDFWKTVLAQGGIWLPPVERKVELSADAAEMIKDISPAAFPQDKPILLPIPTIQYGDGRHTDKLWLNEMQDPITTLVWDNPLLVSPATATEWGCKSGDIIRFSTGKSVLEAPVYVQAGLHDGVVALPIGTAGDCAPFHAYPGGNPMHGLSGEVDARSGALVWTNSPVQFQQVTGQLQLAKTQGSFEQGPREIARAVFLNKIGEKEKVHQTFGDLYPDYEYPVHKWAMIIDLTLCIGCGACEVACHAENNVFVVGKEQCMRGRKLSWLRIQRFMDKGRTVFQPMLCQHCGHAPCETVCPVYASVHNSEGLNVQVYNRCVGTRYCANNCPYKVRRFNWFTHKYPPPLQRQFNPYVSVRTRGTMEKCSFCIQRIREQKEIAKDEGRELREGEVMPACAQSCPTQAIRFGDLKNPQSWVARNHDDPRGYVVLEHLNTQPSIIYLKQIIHHDIFSVEQAGVET